MPGLKVKDIMTRSFICVDAASLLEKIKSQVRDGDWEAIILLADNGEIKGIVSGALILNSQAVGSKASDIFPWVNPISLSEEEGIGNILPLLQEKKGGALVKGAEGKITGVIPRDTLVSKIIGGWQKSQALLETLLQYAGEAICVINEREDVEYWNPRAEVLYGIREQDILGRPVGSFFTNLLVSRSLRDRKVFRDLYHQPREGAHVLITSAPVPVGDSIIGSISLERDIADIVYFNEELSRTGFKMGLLKKEINRLSKKDPFSRIYGHSTIIKKTISIAKKYAATDTTVLITGESGTGKELFAQAIHDESNRSQRPFVAVNCSAIPNTLFESEIFGYEGGAFTGAFKEGKPGKFELADGGTLFLDEVGELDPSVQVKLLRVLQEKILYRVGGTRPIKFNVRVIAATNRNLEKMVDEGRFREDLFYRLNVITLSLPPLRDRREDMPELAYLLAQELADHHGRKIVEFDPKVMVAFMGYHWPGNVRELRNVLERMVILAEDEVIRHESLPEFLRIKTPSGMIDGYRGSIKLTEVTHQAERQMIMEALEKSNNNKLKAAKILGIPRSSLYYKMKTLGIMSEN